MNCCFLAYIKGGALRVNELRLACANRLKCNAHGPTMNLFERFSRVVKVPYNLPLILFFNFLIL